MKNKENIITTLILLIILLLSINSINAQNTPPIVNLGVDNYTVINSDGTIKEYITYGLPVITDRDMLKDDTDKVHVKSINDEIDLYYDKFLKIYLLYGENNIMVAGNKRMIKKYIKLSLL